MTVEQETELRRALQLGSLHDINAAMGHLRDLETWRRVTELSPSFGAVLDAQKTGNRDATFTAMDALTARWTTLLASMG